MDIPVIFQDDALVIVDKPAGMPVLPDGWIKNSPYLFKTLTEQFERIYLVHRLDKQTSGIILFSKTPEAHRLLSMQFEHHLVIKKYFAILTGSVSWADISSNLPLRINVGHSHRTVVDEEKGKPAETSFHVLERYSDNTLVEVSIKTGRTHQIRAHANALGHPVLGDLLYHAPETQRINRPALHAYSLTFKHPVSGEYLSFTAPPPRDFLDAIDTLKNQS
jgi:tRNA pseudouridine32 synthase / 23S rRNA pseudouridine746 synthase